MTPKASIYAAQAAIHVQSTIHAAALQFIKICAEPVPAFGKFSKQPNTHKSSAPFGAELIYIVVSVIKSICVDYFDFRQTVFSLRRIH